MIINLSLQSSDSIVPYIDEIQKTFPVHWLEKHLQERVHFDMQYQAEISHTQSASRNIKKFPSILTSPQLVSRQSTNHLPSLQSPKLPSSSLPHQLFKKTPKQLSVRLLERGLYRNAKLNLGKTRLQTPPLLAEYNNRRATQPAKPKLLNSNLQSKRKSDSIEVDLLLEERGVVNMVRRISESYGLFREYGYSQGQIYKLVYSYCRRNRDMEKIFFQNVEQPDNDTASVAGPLKKEKTQILKCIRLAVYRKSVEGVKELVYRIGQLADNLQEGVLRKTDSKVNELLVSIKDRQNDVNQKRKEINEGYKDAVVCVQSPRMIKLRYNDFRQEVKEIQKKYGSCEKITEINRKLFEILNNISGRGTFNIKHPNTLDILI